LLNRELKDERERDEHRSSKDVRSDEDTKTTTAKSNSAVTNQEE
jgi:hypothetical protein